MNDFLTIQEVSNLLDIPKSTLRYWQDKGIFATQRTRNNYRQYTLSDVVEIAEIAFNRSLGIPVRQLETFGGMEIEDYARLLNETAEALKEKIASLESMYKQAIQKSAQIQIIRFLKNISYVREEVPFERVIAFSYKDRRQLIRYTKNPSLYVRVIPSDSLDDDVRGIIAGDEDWDSSPLLWTKEKGTAFASFLIEENASEGYTNNIAEKLALIQTQHRTGLILANFLLSATLDGKRIDYLKGYVELLD